MLNRFFYKSYRFFFIFDEWRKKRLTKGGLLVLPAILISAGIGLDTFQSMTYQGFTFLAALFLIALIKSRYHDIDLHLERRLPRFGTVGERFKYRLTIVNPTQRELSDLALIEHLEDPRPAFSDLLAKTEPEENKRNRWDRKTMYFRWVWLVSKNRRANVKPFALPAIPPNAKIEKELELLPLKRGPMYFEGFDVIRPDPFGLYNSLKKIVLRQKIVILPKRYQIPDFNLPGNRKHQPGGIALASSVGNSEEFTALRDYRPGDPLRRIHWKSWAKTGKPVVKEYQDEFFVRHALILDTFLTDDHDDVFEEAVSLAASLACTIRTQESLLDLMFIGDQAYRFSSGRSLSPTDNLLEILSSVQPCMDKPFSTLTAAVSNHAKRLSGCIIILLTWDEERQKLLNHLRAVGLPLKALVILSDKPGAYADTFEMTAHPNVHMLKAGHLQKELMML